MNYSYHTYRQRGPNFVSSEINTPLNTYYTEESKNFYTNNFLTKNIGKMVKVYVSFADSFEWRDRIFEGILEASGGNFILIKDNRTHKNYMIMSFYIDYIEFSEEVKIN